MKKLALMDGNTVTNIIVADDDFSPQNSIEVTENTGTPNIGWTFADGVFSAPAPPPPPPPTTKTVFTKFEFRSRFTFAELVAVDNYATSSTLTDQQKATLNTVIKNFDSAQDVDVTHASTIQGVEYLVQCNLITSQRAAIILAGEVSE